MPAAEFTGWIAFLNSENEPQQKGDVESQLLGIFGVPNGG